MCLSWLDHDEIAQKKVNSVRLRNPCGNLSIVSTGTINSINQEYDGFVGVGLAVWGAYISSFTKAMRKEEND